MQPKKTEIWSKSKIKSISWCFYPTFKSENKEAAKQVKIEINLDSSSTFVS